MNGNDEWLVLSGTSNRKLAENICKKLERPLGRIDIRRFSDGEISVEIKENVRGRKIYVVQSICRPGNDNLMELLIIIDALKRASAKEINAVIPYYGYSRQDRKVAPRTPISAKLMADLLVAAGTTRVISMDLHAGQIQGFFNIPFDNLYSLPVIRDYFTKYFPEDILSPNKLVIVSPDAGGVERARGYAKRLNAAVAMIDKRRTAPNIAKAMYLVGKVRNKIAIILDDIVDTAGTLSQASMALKKKGAIEIYAAATHPVLSGPAIERIEKSALKKLIVTDTIPMSEELLKSGKFEQLTVAPLLAQAIHRIQNCESVSKLFQ